MVFCGLFPIDTDDYPDLRDALEKLTLNDAALTWEPETTDALGFGFRCGFLGLLHMDIVRERLQREYDLELLATMPSVGLRGHAHQRRGARGPRPERHARPGAHRGDPRAVHQGVDPHAQGVHRPGHGALPGAPRRRTPACTTCRAERVQLTYDLPLAEIVLDFFDQLKSRTRGYASLDYEIIGMRAGDLVKLDVLLAGDAVDALSMLVHRDKAYARRAHAGREAAREDPAPAVRRADPGRDRLATSSPARRSRPSARTSSPSATAATSRASASCSRSRRRARGA